MDRLSSEQVFHDQQAAERSRTFQEDPERFQFPDQLYLDHETWIRPAFEQLGDLCGLHVLDFGCGHGMASVVLARRGARVTAFDLSLGYLAEARDRADANGRAIQFVKADGAKLPFADGVFDRIWGNAVLHHLDLRVAGPELVRVLRPSGYAVFAEPWGHNPLLRLARNHLPYPGKARTPDEQPLDLSHIQVLHKVFRHVEVRGFQLVSMVRRVLRWEKLVARLDWCDAMLLARVPSLQRFCRYVVLTLRP
jgi:SAM-dependent methyltransferase